MSIKLFLEGKVMSQSYSIGLDIGTNSVGWAVTKENHDLVKRRMKVMGNTNHKAIKKNFWGVRLFDEGKTAADRRMKRTTRRRYTRRKNRLNVLQKTFDSEMSLLDPTFFDRLGESFYVPKDKTYSAYPVFATLDEEKAYHKAYPTIYHLRKELVDNKEQADLRLVYLALAHITKYRGHFLIDGKLDVENSSVEETWSTFLIAYNEALNTEDVEGAFSSVSNDIAIDKIASQPVSKTQKFDEIMSCFPEEKKNGFFAQFVKLIVGNQANFKQSFKLNEDSKLEFSKDDYEDNLSEVLEKIGDGYADVLLAARNVYEAIQLSDILSTRDENTKAKLSSSMIERYSDHKEDLERLKEYMKAHQPKDYYPMFKDEKKDGYAGYIDGKTTEENFYKFLKKTLVKNAETEPFLEKIEREDFLRKQRTFDNGVIPHQVHVGEFKAILNNQEKYYPFLKEEREKLISNVTFRIPYYVGPLAQKDNKGEFAWLVRRSEEAITPLNFSDVVDEKASATKFIERMTNFDTYLPTERVLPQHSLIYQRYMVFNELTKVSFEDDSGHVYNLSGAEKIDIFNDLFKVKKRITATDLIDYLENKHQYHGVKIVRGLDEGRFNATYSTYIDFVSKHVDKSVLDDPRHEDDFEEIIKILTIFEDRPMIREQLAKYDDILSTQALKKLEKRHFTGWGRLSRKLLVGIKDQETKKTIMDFLITDDGGKKHINRNFMQLINDPALSFKDEIAQAQQETDMSDLDKVVSELPGSPAIKKGILQSLKIVEEIVEIMGYNPSNIVVEMARENQRTNRTQTRYKQLEKMLKELKSKILEEHPTDNQALRNDRLYLYYLQNGRDMYTGQELDIHKLEHYDIDHIIPQSFIVDNSIDNLVLVSSKENRGKSDDVPSQKVIDKNIGFWNQLVKAKLMSDRKYANLTKGALTDADKEGFIRRQLVETRQITKHVAQILDSRFNTEKDEKGQIIRDVPILTLKSSLTSQFRQQFNIYKVREINDYHHAHDAYLNTVVGNTLLKAYPKLRAEFVYGEFSSTRLKSRMTATDKKNFYGNIMSIFKKEESINAETGEVYWSKRDITQVKKVIGYNQMNIVKKVEKQKGQFTNESIMPKSDSKKLIPRKTKGREWSTESYGGVISPTIVYSVFIEYKKGKKEVVTNDVIGIPLMDQRDYENNRLDYLETKGFLEARVLFELPKYSLFEMNDGKKRLLSSAGELQKGNQLVLPEKLVKILYYSNQVAQGRDSYLEYLEGYEDNYDQILDIVKLFSEKYILAQSNLNKIESLYFNNKNSPIKEKAESMINLLRFTQMGAPAEFKFFGENIPRKRYTGKSDMTELFDATLIYQSITGLYETRMKVSDM